MFSLAFLVGIYAKGLYILGLFQLYSLTSISVYTALFVLLSIIGWRYFDEDINLRRLNSELLELWSKYKLLSLFILASVAIVFLGILVPEIAFDSLWYHLTLPKLYLENGGISFIPGSLFYYSALPKLGELLYLLPVGLHLEQLAKAIHALFGVGICIVLYKLAKEQTNKYFALLSVVIFLSNIVVLWQATTSYVDLMRAFFETLALYGLLLFEKTQKKKWLIESAICMGLAIETKLISLSTLIVYSLFAILSTNIRREKIGSGALYIFLALLVPLPWFVFSYIHTGNPIYPIFTGFNPPFEFHLLTLIKDAILIFIFSSDPVSPVYLAFLPLVPFIWKRLTGIQRKIFLLAVGSFLAWILTPRTGGGRFILSYLPLFSLCVVITLYYSRLYIQKLFIFFIFILAATTLLYRGVAQFDSFKVALGIQSKTEYLVLHLNYNFGDFYDTDNYFKNTLGENDRVLLVGFHNLYYADFKFIHQSYLKSEDTFNYIATQNAELPEKYSHWTKIYVNRTTNVTLYKDPKTKRI